MDRADWNRRYASQELFWSGEPNLFLVQEVADLPPGRAIDLAAGEGRNAIWLTERGWRTTAVDFAESGLEKGRRIATERGLEVNWVPADLLEFDPGEGCFDLVLLFYLQVPWNEMRTVLGRAARSVAPGGTFLLVGHDRSNLQHGHGGPRSEKVLYTPEAVAAELGDLQIVEATTRLRPVELEDRSVNAIDCFVRAIAAPRRESR
jgi:SAM-dependent methyltransferase